METNLTPITICGICVHSNLGKIPSIIINSRLVHFLSENNVLSKCQIGFYQITVRQTTYSPYTPQLTNKHGACLGGGKEGQRGGESVYGVCLLGEMREEEEQRRSNREEEGNLHMGQV